MSTKNTFLRYQNSSKQIRLAIAIINYHLVIDYLRSLERQIK